MRRRTSFVRASHAELAASLLVLVATTTGCGNEAASDGSGDVAQQQYTPQSGQYEHIGLPAQAPPAGALLSSISYADSQPHGQQMLIQYDGLTVNVCAYPAVDRKAMASCEPQSTEAPLREETAGGWVTRYTISQKGSRTSDAKTEQVRDFFAGAPLTADPDWVQTYAAKERKKRLD